MLAIIVLAASAVVLASTLFIPIVVALITKIDAAPGLKGAVLVVLAALSALLAPVVESGADLAIDNAFLGSFAVAAIGAVAVYFGLLRPAGVTAAIQEKVPGGIG